MTTIIKSEEKTMPITGFIKRYATHYTVDVWDNEGALYPRLSKMFIGYTKTEVKRKIREELGVKSINWEEY